MSRLPFNVAGNSLTFYVKGRPYHLHKDHQNFDIARQHLLTPGTDHDAEMLVDLVDIRKGLERASFGAIQFDDETILWRGKPLTGIWVDRILAHRAAGEAFDHLWKALDKLVHNPTVTAIERLPIFLDRVGLGFLPDGRFLAFKGVQADYHSAHENTDGTRFRHLVGDAPRMPREEVDPDPNQTCSTGLHVGAPGYVRGHYSGGRYALVLVAVDPVDVVSVPTDYQGEKMRVCGYEVIEHLDQSYSDELFGRLRTMTAVPTPTPAPAPVTGADLAALACVGDVVHYAGHDSDGHAGYFEGGEYEVIEIDEDENGDGRRLRVATSTEATWIYDEHVTKLIRDGVEVRPADDIEPAVEPEPEDDNVVTFKAGQVVEYVQYDATLYGVMVTDDEVRDLDGDKLVPDEIVRELEPGEITAACLVVEGAEIQLAGDPFVKDGTYTIVGYSADDGDSQVDDDSAFWLVEHEAVDGGVPITNSAIKTVTLKGEHLWPRTKTEVAVEGDTVTMTSLDGHNLRRDTVDVHPLVEEALAAAGPETAPPPRAEPGDLIEIKQEGGWLPAGVYPVVSVPHEWGYEVQTEHDGVQPVSNGRVISIIRRPWLRAEVGGYVVISAAERQDDGLYSAVGSGRWEVTDLQLRGDNPQIQVRMPPHGNWWIDATRVTKVEPKA